MKKSQIIAALVGVIVLAGTTWEIVHITSSSVQSTPSVAPSKATINGITYQTTGAIVPADVNGELALKEMINLVYKGKVTTAQFRLNPPGDGTEKVELLPPYDTNKTAFINWLKTNGYSHIDPTSLTYVNVTQ